MRKFTPRTFLCVAAFSAVTLLSSTAFAAVHPLGNIDPVNAGSYNETDATGAVDVEGTFSLTVGANTALSATIATGSAGSYTPGLLELFMGANSDQFRSARI